MGHFRKNHLFLVSFVKVDGVQITFEEKDHTLDEDFSQFWIWSEIGKRSPFGAFSRFW